MEAAGSVSIEDGKIVATDGEPGSVKELRDVAGEVSDEFECDAAGQLAKRSGPGHQNCTVRTCRARGIGESISPLHLGNALS